MNEVELVIFDGTLASNGQITVKKSVREQLQLVAGDVIFLEVKRVISKDAVQKFPSEVHREVYDDTEY